MFYLTFSPDNYTFMFSVCFLMANRFGRGWSLTELSLLLSWLILTGIAHARFLEDRLCSFCHKVVNVSDLWLDWKIRYIIVYLEETRGRLLTVAAAVYTLLHHAGLKWEGCLHKLLWLFLMTSVAKATVISITRVEVEWSTWGLLAASGCVLLCQTSVHLHALFTYELLGDLEWKLHPSRFYVAKNKVRYLLDVQVRIWRKLENLVCITVVYKDVCAGVWWSRELLSLAEEPSLLNIEVFLLNLPVKLISRTSSVIHLLTKIYNIIYGSRSKLKF